MEQEFTVGNAAGRLGLLGSCLVVAPGSGLPHRRQGCLPLRVLIRVDGWWLLVDGGMELEGGGVDGVGDFARLLPPRARSLNLSNFFFLPFA